MPHSILTVILFISLALSACSPQNNASLKLLTNAWIGYSPLFYAKEKGWLDELNIELSTVVSLGESAMIYNTGNFDGITGTQYEYEQLNNQSNSLIPVIMFDRSNGGDMILSSHPIEFLAETDQIINVHLELNSINYVVFKDFIRTHKLEEKSFNFINQDQIKTVSSLKDNSLKTPTLVVTYIPYNFALQKQGFKIIASTKDIQDLLVIDSLFIAQNSLTSHKQHLVGLKHRVDEALKHLEENPRAYYDTVKAYLGNPSYEDFMAGLQDIEWMNNKMPKPVSERLNHTGFPTKDLL
ncbi:MAG: hypothetical protein GXO35_07400 [Gammaproteobacteria bacterium]|nr:hypothetical protein [Gammaproteobacteria bacterium]